MNYDDVPAPASSTTIGTGVDVEAAGGEEEYYEEEEESRELSHDEIWDDSALIDAWNSAAAEYEVRLPLRQTARRVLTSPGCYRPTMAQARVGRTRR